jgi:glycosyltransferase involved in cell wall biosynthesis
VQSGETWVGVPIKKQMNISLISNVAGCSWAGSEELWLATAIAALQSGHHVTACLHGDLHSAEPLKAFKKAGGDLINWSRLPIARFEKARQALFPQFIAQRLGNPDVLVISLGALQAINYVPGLVEYLLKTSTPFVIICQFNSDALAISPRERHVTRMVLERSHSVIFVSEQNRSLARRQYALELSSSQVILNPIRIKLDSPLPWRVADKQVVFGCVARFETLWKGQDLLLEILATDLWKSRNWKLKFFGDGPDLEHVKNYAQMLRMDDQVTFEGYLRDVQQIWAETDIMVLPSRGEGTPLAVLEAMMCGRPVVTTDVGGNLEVLKEGVAGWIADAATPRSFAQAMERAWINRDKWKKMGLSAHEKALQLSGTKPDKVLLDILTGARRQNFYQSFTL